MPSRNFTIATCQFPVSDEVVRNARYIRRYIRKSAERGADLVLFPECALTGWRPDPKKFAKLDWRLIERETTRIVAETKAQGIWTALGSYHFFKGKRKPTNCLYLISPKGEIVERYDKRKLFGREPKTCAAGKEPLIKTINGHRCGFLICNDSNSPELYREYQQKRVAILIHPLFSVSPDGGPNTLSELTLAQFRTRATDHGAWVVASNSSAKYSNLPASVFRPDGTVRVLHRHKTGILTHTFPDDNLEWTPHAIPGSKLR